MLEKAGALGEHNLSGAVVNPRAFRELFPDLSSSDIPFRQPVAGEAVYFLTEGRAQRIPTPPTMHNARHSTPPPSARSCAGWASGRSRLGVNLFAGFPADALLVEGDAVRGVRTTPSGLDRDRPADGRLRASRPISPRKVTVLAEGTRGLLGQALARVAAGPLAQSADLRARREGGLGDPAAARRSDPHPRAGRCPTTRSAAASCIRWGRRQVALGLVVGLDYHDASLDVHELLQRMKLHPLFRPYPRGRRAGGVGCQDDPRGRVPRAARAPERRRHPAGGRHRGLRGRPLAQGHPLRHAVGDLRRARRVRRRSSRATLSAARLVGVRPRWWTRATSWPTCTGPGTCGSRSRTGSTSAGSRPG